MDRPEKITLAEMRVSGVRDLISHTLEEKGISLGNPDAEFILTNADRLITVTIRCVISFGAADGLNDFLLADKKDQHEDWREAVWCFQRDGLLMAALRAALLFGALSVSLGE